MQPVVSLPPPLPTSLLPPCTTDHRYQYPISDTPIAIMPTLDYYGYEHEDAITGVCDNSENRWCEDNNNTGEG